MVSKGLGGLNSGVRGFKGFGGSCSVLQLLGLILDDVNC